MRRKESYMIFPYTDDLMRFDETRNRYFLTEFALVMNGTDLRTRLTFNRTLDPTTVINRVLSRVSEMIYNYIHSFNSDNRRQDELIAKLPSLRSIIYNAMINQAEYFIMNGDFSRSAEPDKRMLAIDATAKEYLNTVISEIGVPITYAGVL